MNKSNSASSDDVLLHYMVRCSPLGQALIAATHHGVAALLLGDHKASLLDELQRRYPFISLRTGGAVLERWGSTVMEIVNHPSLQHVVPLDVLQGTDFQLRVWKALRGIPAGQTRSYADLARAIGQPKAVRAVASACGADPLAVLVPCHRVLRSDGSLGGYHWGVERKLQLLQKEGAMLV